MREEEDDKPKREVNEMLVDSFCDKYVASHRDTADAELTMYDIRMFFNLFYVNDPRLDLLDSYLKRLHERGFAVNTSYDGEPVIFVHHNH